MIAGLPLVAAAPPAPVRRELVHSIAQVVSRGRKPRQELIVQAREGLALVTQLLAEHLAFRRAVTTSATDVVHYQLAHLRCPSLGGRSGHVFEARFTEVSPRDRVLLAFRRFACPFIRHLIAFHIRMPWDPSEGQSVSPAFQPPLRLHQGNGESLSRAHLV